MTHTYDVFGIAGLGICQSFYPRPKAVAVMQRVTLLYDLPQLRSMYTKVARNPKLRAHCRI